MRKYFLMLALLLIAGVAYLLVNCPSKEAVTISRLVGLRNSILQYMTITKSIPMTAGDVATVLGSKPQPVDGWGNPIALQVNSGDEIRVFSYSVSMEEGREAKTKVSEGIFQIPKSDGTPSNQNGEWVVRPHLIGHIGAASPTVPVNH